MKILFVIPAIAPSYGGPSQATIEMSQALIERGVQVEIATTNADLDQNLNVPLGKKVLHEGIPTYFFPRSSKMEYKFSWPLTKWLRENIRNYDLLHINYVFCYSTAIAAYYARKYKVPYLIHCAGILDHWSMKQRPLRKWLYLKLVERRNLNGAAVIHYTSEEEKSASERFGFSSQGVVIPLGVQVNSKQEETEQNLFRNKYPQHQGKKQIVFLSRLHPKKNLELVIKSLSKLRKVRDDFVLIIAGSGEPNYQIELKEKIRRSGLATHAIFTGFLREREKFMLLRDADLFVLPSYQENFGIALVEAMSRGLPVLITPGVHLSSLIEKEEAGRVSTYDEGEFSRHINELLDDDELRKKLGSNARRLVIEKFSWQVIAPQIKALYQKILKKRP